MKGKRDKSIRLSNKYRNSHSDVESHEMLIGLKSYVNDLNSNSDVYYFNVQVLYNGRFIDKQAIELAKDMEVEKSPFIDPPGLAQSRASSESEKVEILLGIGFDKSFQFIECLRIEEAEINDKSFLDSCLMISTKYDTISKLHLIDCCLNAKCIEIIAKQLRAENNTIKDLSLDLNVVPEQNYHLLINGTTLEHLSLRHCRIDCKGAKLISEALEYRTFNIKQCLLSLVLNGNAIEDAGLFYITMALRSNFKLHYLALAHNFITDSGIEMIAGVLKKFPISLEEDSMRRFMFIKYLESAAKQHGIDCIDSIHNAVEKLLCLTFRESSCPSSDLDVRTNGDEIRNQEESFSKISNTPISFTHIMNGGLHPLLITVYKDGGLKYCVGNFGLAFLNLSYNSFGKIGLNALIEAVKYQSNVGPQINGFGLMGIKAEGLKRKENIDREIGELNNILGKRSLPKMYDRRHLINHRHDIQ